MNVLRKNYDCNIHIDFAFILGKDNYVSKNMDWWWLIDIKLYFSCITDSFWDMNKRILSEVIKMCMHVKIGKH